jgi:hypothetical protein
LLEIVDRKCDVRDGSDDRRHLAFRIESDPLYPIWATLEAADVDTEPRNALLAQEWLRMWDAEMMISPAEAADYRGWFFWTSRGQRHVVSSWFSHFGLSR